jgi:hypothetical protein
LSFLYAVPFVFAEMPPPDPRLFWFAMTAFTCLVQCLLDEEEELHRQALMLELVARAIVAGRHRQRDGHDDDGVAQQRHIIVPWNHERARQAVLQDYMGPNPTFNDQQFEPIFRVSRQIANDLLNTCTAQDPFFHESIDCTGKPSIHPKVKLLMAFKILAFGVNPSAFLDYFQMGITTGRE